MTPVKRVAPRFGFKTSIVALFVAIVLFIGLALVYLSFARVTAVTDSAASQVIGRVAELSADRIGSQQGARRGGREGLEHRGHEEGLKPHLSGGRQGLMTRRMNF